MLNMQTVTLLDGRDIEIAHGRLDGVPTWFLRCPVCHRIGAIDDDQFCGRVSIDCFNEACSFHETIDIEDAQSSSS